ncbi:hypothetical protein AYI69_g3368 [Smittium culicis]|uniref:Uncharacterized protein n=1 Tax=Smittium culicis TaxID=133412 RepID=A0A1R1YK85_9FUNG|nr:hypothetical protein AYI69_g3368 [Smittium culicis]
MLDGLFWYNAISSANDSEKVTFSAAASTPPWFLYFISTLIHTSSIARIMMYIPISRRRDFGSISTAVPHANPFRKYPTPVSWPASVRI